MRVSNFLLWQIAYAEIWVTDTLWPDFRARHLFEAIVDFQKRERRYGGVGSLRRERPRRRDPQGRSRQPSVTRVLSALVLLPALLAIAWYLPPIYTTLVLGLVVALAFDEYARMARLGSEGFPRVIAGIITLTAYVGVWSGIPLPLVLAPALLAGAACRGRPRPARRGRDPPRRGHPVPGPLSRRAARDGGGAAHRSWTAGAAGALPGGRRQRFGAVLRRPDDGPAAAGAAHQPEEDGRGRRLRHRRRRGA